MRSKFFNKAKGGFDYSQSHHRIYLFILCHCKQWLWFNENAL